ncbi:MAG: type II toxin-antitoxin system VapC family toxin [Chitinophagales bacterium]|nr:type II toxin-antitoxin system VapC family toxin [Chitinophagales bacterium]
MTKVLLDTNIFIYALDKNSAYFERSMAILSNSNFQLFTTSKNIAEYFAVTTKLRIPPKQIWDFYKEIKRNVEILYPTDESLKKLERLIKKYQPKGNQVYDMDVIATALSSGIKRFATFNQNDLQQVNGIALV